MRSYQRGIQKKDPDNITSDEVEQTVACLTEGLNCTQAILSTYGPQFGMEHKSAVKVAGAFGSGMGMGEMCGAVTGALMVIGLNHAKVRNPSFISKVRTRAIAQEFVKQFKARNGATACKELLNCDVNTSEGLKTAKYEKHFKKRCPKFVQDAAEIWKRYWRESKNSKGKKETLKESRA